MKLKLNNWRKKRLIFKNFYFRLKVKTWNHQEIHYKNHLNPTSNESECLKDKIKTYSKKKIILNNNLKQKMMKFYN